MKRSASRFFVQTKDNAGGRKCAAGGEYTMKEYLLQKDASSGWRRTGTLIRQAEESAAE